MPGAGGEVVLAKPSVPTTPVSSCSQIGAKTPFSSGKAPARKKITSVPGAIVSGTRIANWAGTANGRSPRSRSKPLMKSKPGASGIGRSSWASGAISIVAGSTRAPAGTITSDPSAATITPPSTSSALPLATGASTRTIDVASANRLTAVTVVVPGASEVTRPSAVTWITSELPG